MPVAITSGELSLRLHRRIAVEVLGIDCSARTLGVQVPENPPALCRELPVKRLTNHAVMMKIDLGGNPHPVGIPSDLSKAVGFSASSEDDDFFSCRRAHPKALIVLKLSPAAPPPEQRLQSEAVAAPDIEPRVRKGRPGGQVQPVGRVLEQFCENEHVIHRLSGAHRSLCHTYRGAETPAHIVPVLFSKAKGDAIHPPPLHHQTPPLLPLPDPQSPFPAQMRRDTVQASARPAFCWPA